MHYEQQLTPKIAKSQDKIFGTKKKEIKQNWK